MLRISVRTDGDGGTCVDLEGQIIGPWVGELAHVCEPLLRGPRLLTLDLAAVSFVGREGVGLLARLRHDRVTLRNCSRLVDEQLKARQPNGH
jgi:anti-anti-sigma regulatory factor